MSKILVMGYPGSGKTYLARCIVERLELAGKTVEWFNADEIRELYDDWDFTIEGRIRQSIRMGLLCLASDSDYQLCDFVCPMVEMRDKFAADYTIWMDTIPHGRFEDTNRLFVPPIDYDYRVTEWDGERYAGLIVSELLLCLLNPR